MKIAVSSSGDHGLSSSLDPRFGRAAAFIIFDSESEEFQVIDNNQNLNATQGAGVQAAQNVVDADADILITGHCGPKAFRALIAGGVKIYYCHADKVDLALTQFQQGNLEEAKGADVEGHW